MRTFIAVEIPEEIRTKIAELQQELRHNKASVSWLRPQNIHVTLKFLGEVNKDRLSGVFRAVEETAAPFEPFPVEVIDKGAFPNFRRPRVLWVGIGRGETELKSISRVLEERLEAVGFPREKRPYTPHLTICRVKSPKNIDRMMRDFERISFAGGAFTAEELIVMKSDLKPSGAVYTPMRKTVLGSGN